MCSMHCLTWQYVHNTVKLIHMSIHSFIHSYLSGSPVKQLSNEIGKQTALHRCNVCVQWGTACFPRGTVYDTAVTTPVPCSLQHHTLHLGLGRPQPYQPACVLVTRYRVSSPHLLPPHVTQSRDCQHTSSQKYNYLIHLQSSVIATQVTGVQAETAFVRQSLLAGKLQHSLKRNLTAGRKWKVQTQQAISTVIPGAYFQVVRLDVQLYQQGLTQNRT